MERCWANGRREDPMPTAMADQAFRGGHSRGTGGQRGFRRPKHDHDLDVGEWRASPTESGARGRNLEALFKAQGDQDPSDV